MRAQTRSQGSSSKAHDCFPTHRVQLNELIHMRMDSDGREYSHQVSNVAPSLKKKKARVDVGWERVDERRPSRN